MVAQVNDGAEAALFYAEVGISRSVSPNPSEQFAIFFLFSSCAITLGFLQIPEMPEIFFVGHADLAPEGRTRSLRLTLVHYLPLPTAPAAMDSNQAVAS